MFIAIHYMKILHVSEVSLGGVGTIIEQIANFSIEYEHVCIIPNMHSDSIKKTKSKVYDFDKTGRNIRSFYNLLKMFFKVLKNERPDIIHIHSTFAGVLCRGMLLFYPFPGKVIYCPHAFSFMMTSSKFKKKLYVMVERLLACKTDKIICTSLYERNLAIINGIKKSKLHVIYNSVKAPHPVKSNSPYRIECMNLLFVGRFSYQKGFDLVQRLSERLSGDYHITAIGNYSSVPKMLVQEDNISYPGWLSSEDMAKYFYHADVLIMPSRWESFGLVAVEANSYGLPVIAANNTALPEVVVEGVTGHFFETDSFDELIELVLSKDKNYWKNMRSNCLKRYDTLFKTDEMIKNIELLYKNL